MTHHGDILWFACLSLCKSNWHSVRTLKMFSQFESAKIFKAPSVWLPPVSNHHLWAQLLPIWHISASSLPWSLWSSLSKITRCLPDTKKNPTQFLFSSSFLPRPSMCNMRYNQSFSLVLPLPVKEFSGERSTPSCYWMKTQEPFSSHLGNKMSLCHFKLLF